MLNLNSLVITTLISAATAVSATIIIFFFSNYASLFFAYDFDIPASFNLSGMVYTDAGSMNWSRDAIITILLSKPISSFFIGIAFLALLMLDTKKHTTTIILLFWLNVFAFNSVFGVLIDDAISGIGTYEVAAEMNISNSYLIMISIILAFIFYKIGIMNARLIILSFPNLIHSSSKHRVIFFSLVLFIPWLMVIIYTFITTGGLFSTSAMLKTIPVVIFLIPFLTLNSTENPKIKYLPAKHLSVTDIFFTAFFIVISIVLILVMKEGVTIS